MCGTLETERKLNDRRLGPVFVWQIGVDERARGTGLGLRMLHALADQLHPEGVRHVEATVAPSNTASDRLFRRFAEDRKVPCEVMAHFAADLFGNEAHEPEHLYRIGPFRAPKHGESTTHE